MTKTSLAYADSKGQGSACTSAKSDQGLPCLLSESLDTIECISGEQKSGWDFLHVKDYLNLRILHMFEDFFHLTWPILGHQNTFLSKIRTLCLHISGISFYNCKSNIWVLTLVLLNPDIPCLCKQCRSRSGGFWRGHLIWICTVWH